MTHRSVLSIALVVAACGTAKAYDCRYERDLSLDINASGASVLEVKAGAGSLSVTGVEGLDAVRVRGVACASDEDVLDAMAFEDTSRGDRIGVATVIPDRDGGWWGNRQAAIHVTVEVPAGLNLEINDGSGETRIRHVASVRVRDGSGELTIEDVTGEVDVRDGSGALSIRTVSGSVTITDGSGEIEVRDVEGFVLVEEDGSGEIDIRHVGRDATVERDGSGAINIENVAGDVRVGRDGSGGIDVREVAGNFEVRSDGSGGVRYSGVRGDVDIPSEERRRRYE